MPRSVGPQTPYDPRAQMRPRVSRELFSTVAGHITERDKQICLDIYEHNFLTTHQVKRLHFLSYTRARTRLLALNQLRVLERFRPHRRTGSYPHYFVLDEIGMQIVASLRGVDPKQFRYDKSKALGQVYSPRLLHMTEVNDFFTRLVEAARKRGPGVGVDSWLGEKACLSTWDGYVRPDGYCRLKTDGRTLSFWLELDGATEIRSRLVGKLEQYRLVVGTRDAADFLLFCFPTSAREAKAREVLSDCGVTVATSVLPEHMQDPLAPIWLPIAGNKRMSLCGLLSPGDPRESA